jgi:DNA-binding response OmpR family regulator
MITPPEAPSVVLHVEDEAPNRALLRAALARAGEARVRDAVLVEAVDLASAREALATRSIDLVLLDVRLPDGNGLDIARDLARRAASERPAVMILSASVLPADREAALRSGADRFMSKPYRPSELVAAVIKLLDFRPAS